MNCGTRNVMHGTGRAGRWNASLRQARVMMMSSLCVGRSSTPLPAGRGIISLPTPHHHVLEGRDHHVQGASTRWRGRQAGGRRGVNQTQNAKNLDDSASPKWGENVATALRFSACLYVSSLVLLACVCVVRGLWTWLEKSAMQAQQQQTGLSRRAKKHQKHQEAPFHVYVPCRAGVLLGGRPGVGPWPRGTEQP